jgi:hypothetical protein
MTAAANAVPQAGQHRTAPLHIRDENYIAKRLSGSTELGKSYSIFARERIGAAPPCTGCEAPKNTER